MIMMAPHAAAQAVKVDDWLGKPIALVVALAAVSLLPFVFMGMTSFVKISTVFHIVRSAIGAQNIPSNTVIMALSTALTLIAMAPVGHRIVDGALPIVRASASTKPLETSEWVERGIKAVGEPMKAFLQANASEREVSRFLSVARGPRSSSSVAPAEPTDWTVLVPAFLVTELTEAFAVGFLLFLPFAVIDFVVANVLLALGMQSLNPTQMSLPFKLLLFVAINGWGLLAHALVSGYR